MVKSGYCNVPWPVANPQTKSPYETASNLTYSQSAYLINRTIGPFVLPATVHYTFTRTSLVTIAISKPDYSTLIGHVNNPLYAKGINGIFSQTVTRRTLKTPWFKCKGKRDTFFEFLLILDRLLLLEACDFSLIIDSLRFGESRLPAPGRNNELLSRK
uniref:Uncharacterized protein n=1 Tax=Photinus pyralis TaxID=7054 RepID=A0A1Y1KE48_PHOPY